jgi:hypothetical protein
MAPSDQTHSRQRGAQQHRGSLTPQRSQPRQTSQTVWLKPSSHRINASNGFAGTLGVKAGHDTRGRAGWRVRQATGLVGICTRNPPTANGLLSPATGGGHEVSGSSEQWRPHWASRRQRPAQRIPRRCRTRTGATGSRDPYRRFPPITEEKSWTTISIHHARPGRLRHSHPSGVTR